MHPNVDSNDYTREVIAIYVFPDRGLIGYVDFCRSRRAPTRSWKDPSKVGLAGQSVHYSQEVYEKCHFEVALRVKQKQKKPTILC